MRKCYAYSLLLCVTGMLVLVARSPAAYAEEQSVRPGINQAYEDPYFEEWVERFEREGREVYDKRFEIVAAAGVKPGMVVADIGAGTGLFTRLFAREVGPNGQVIAVDISREFVDNVLRISKENGLSNVKGVVDTARDVSLPPASVDVAFICDTYHHFEYPGTIMGSISRALRPDGSLIVVDYRRQAGVSSGWIMNHVRAGKDTVIKEIEASGFQLVEEPDFLKDNYFLRFKKK